MAARSRSPAGSTPPMSSTTTSMLRVDDERREVVGQPDGIGQRQATRATGIADAHREQRRRASTACLHGGTPRGIDELRGDRARDGAQTKQGDTQRRTGGGMGVHHARSYQGSAVCASVGARLGRRGSPYDRAVRPACPVARSVAACPRLQRRPAVRAAARRQLPRGVPELHRHAGHPRRDLLHRRLPRPDQHPRWPSASGATPTRWRSGCSPWASTRNGRCCSASRTGPSTSS